MLPTVSIYPGTSGWSYPAGYGKWNGVFYPKGRKVDELAYYAERFPAVEVNVTFYRLPSLETVRGWVERTPSSFLFSVKLFRKFTHPEFYAREEGLSPEITPEDVAGMRGVLDVLAARERLGAVLVQYADAFSQREENVAAVGRTLERFREYPLAVELRHSSWQNPRTQELLTAYRATRARIDEPFFSNLDEPSISPQPLSYWRLHGRNAAEWRQPKAGAHRYDYLYGEHELDELTQVIERHLQPHTRAFVFFNNHPGGQAVANAIQLASRLHLPLPYQKFANLSNTFPALRAITGEEGGQLGLI